MSNFAIFIITHERANNLLTLDTLKKCNYHGKIYLIIDNEDKDMEIYKLYTNKQISLSIFNKKEIALRADTSLETKDNLSISCCLFPRIYCELFAKKLNLKNFLVLDDDIKNFYHRVNIDNKLKEIKINDFDLVCQEFCNYLNEANIAILGFGNTGSYLGGIHSFDTDCRRKCANAFFRNTNINFDWKCCVLEDVVSCIHNGSLGSIVLELKCIKLEAFAYHNSKNNNNFGGMNNLYNKLSDYHALYSIIYNPIAFTIIQNKHNKFILRTEYNKILPKIISSKYKRIEI